MADNQDTPSIKKINLSLRSAAWITAFIILLFGAATAIAYYKGKASFDTELFKQMVAKHVAKSFTERVFTDASLVNSPFRVIAQLDALRGKLEISATKVDVLLKQKQNEQDQKKKFLENYKKLELAQAKWKTELQALKKATEATLEEAQKKASSTQEGNEKALKDIKELTEANKEALGKRQSELDALKKALVLVQEILENHRLE